MRVIAFNGSARKHGNTAILVNAIFKELKKEDIRTELVQLAGKKIRGCIACGKCFEKKNHRCAIREDFTNDCIGKMVEADGIILVSPNVLRGCHDRDEGADRPVRLRGEGQRRYVPAQGRDSGRGCPARGCNPCLRYHEPFLLHQPVVVPGSSYWNVGIGQEAGEVEKDEEGLGTMKTLGKNMAWLLKKLEK